MSTSALLDISASHTFIAAPQVTKFYYSIQKSLFYPDERMEMHLAYNSLVICHQIVHFPLKLADGAVYTVKFWVVPALNHAIILEIPSLH